MRPLLAVIASKPTALARRITVWVCLGGTRPRRAMSGTLSGPRVSGRRGACVTLSPPSKENSSRHHLTQGIFKYGAGTESAA
jgi:hypothetical protein